MAAGPTGKTVGRLLWFLGLWAAGVVTVVIIGSVIRLALTP